MNEQPERLRIWLATVCLPALAFIAFICVLFFLPNEKIKLAIPIIVERFGGKLPPFPTYRNGSH